MSLLPQLIPPQTATFGKSDELGLVTIDVNWWLFLYNLWKTTLSAPGTPVPISPVDTIALVDGQDISNTDAIQDAHRIINAMALEAQDIELLNGVIAGLPLRDNNVQLLQLDLDISPTLRDMANAIVLATDGLLQDPAPQAQPTAVIVIGGSPFTWTAPANGTLAVTAGTVSLISIIRQTVTVATGITTGLISVRRTDQVQITHTGAPTAVFLPN